MKRIAALIMGFVLMTVLVAPASAKELVVAHDTNFMPFEFKGPDGKFTGFDIELWETIAKKLGLSYKFQPMDFNGIIPGLQTGNVDVGIAGMTITPERAKVVQFSNGYYTSGLKILVRDDEKGISKVEDLAGKVVAVKTGTSSVPFMKDFGKAKELKQFPNNDGMFFELLSKGVDAVVFDMPVVTAFANSAGKGKAKVVGPLYEGQKYGIGFAQGNEELVKKVNAGEELTWDDLSKANWAVLKNSSSAGYIYPTLWLQDHYGKKITDLPNVITLAGYGDAFAQAAAEAVDIVVCYADGRNDYEAAWVLPTGEADPTGKAGMGRTDSIWNELNVIGVTPGIYNDTVSITKANADVYNPEFIAAMQQALINVINTPEGQEIFSVYSHTGYAVATDADYDGARAALKVAQ